MPECTSTGCRRERFVFVVFFPQSALYDGCVVFFCPCSALFKAPWSLESRLVSYKA